MCGKSIRKFIDELDVDSWIYYIILLFLGITIIATVFVNHKLKVKEQTGYTIEQKHTSKDTAMLIY